MKAIIVDDEKRARETIISMLQIHCRNVEVIGEAEDVRSAVNLISKVKPDIVFLDINMPGGSGFELPEFFGSPDFKIIFVTAYEDHAIRAFRLSALDYLLKPLNPEELVSAVGKAETILEKEALGIKLATFVTNMEDIRREVKKIVLKTSDTIHLVNVRDIIRCEADRNYTSFHLENGKSILVSNTLKDYDELLSPYRFFRVHQSHLVNIDSIISYDKKDGGFLQMKDGSVVPVSVRKKDSLLTLLEKI